MYCDTSDGTEDLRWLCKCKLSVRFTGGNHAMINASLKRRQPLSTLIVFSPPEGNIVEVNCKGSFNSTSFKRPRSVHLSCVNLQRCRYHRHHFAARSEVSEKAFDLLRSFDYCHSRYDGKEERGLYVGEKSIENRYPGQS